MWQSLSESIELVHLNGKRDVDVESGMIDMTWEDIVEVFSTHDIRKDKDGPCFIPARFKPKEEMVLVPTYSASGEQLEGNYRKERNVDAITMVVIDLDEPGALEAANEQFSEFERIVVSTHSHTKDTPYKYRMIIRLAEPIPKEEWREAFFNIVAPIGGDPSCQDLARFYFYPSSHPDAGVEPVSYRVPGRAMTKEDIKALGQKHLQSLPEDERKKFERLSNPGSAPQGKRHFTGKVLHHYEAVGSKLDYSYEALCKRHEDYVNDLLSKGHRHEFRMRVCSREVYKHGDKVSWLAVIQFMYRISQTHSAKPFTEGGARKDIPELILSAYGKSMPDMNEKDPEFAKGLAKLLPDIIQTAHDNCISGRWRFPKAEDAKVITVPGVNALPKGSFSESPSLFDMREEYKGAMKGLIQKGEPVAFADDVLNRAFSTKDQKPNVRALGQFIVYCLKGYFERSVKSQNVSKDIHVAVDAINNDKFKLLSQVEMAQDEKSLIQKQAAASIQLGKNPALGKSEWMFSMKRPDQEHVQS